MTVPAVRNHIFGLLVENHAGVLAKIAGLIAAKGYNIESLTVGPTHDETLSHITIVVRGDEWVVEQAFKQLNRLIDVIKVTDLTDEDVVERELLLVRVAAGADLRADVARVAEIFRAGIVDVSASTLTLELTGRSGKLDAFMELLAPYGIQKLYRTGTLAMPRAPKSAARHERRPRTA